MKHSKLVPLIILKKEKLSIIQIAELIIDFYKSLTVADRSYNQVNIISEKETLQPGIKVNELNSVQLLAEEILHQNIDDIRKIDKVEDPDINFSREGVINIGLEVKIDEETLITLNYSFTSTLASIARVVVNELCFDTFEKANFFLKTAEKSFSIDYSVIKISDQAFNKVARGYKAPLGWITYFSNDYEIPIPDDLEGVEYQYTDKGKYLILSRENITNDPEKLEGSKQKLLIIMEEIKARVPEYSK
ncbi:hypothetical protein [Xanthovirga aplysinae]|uniref:hypothetical protein n=1 Tax=Xanthovirga aplysinae TaxID=2529853 RepID=UPI0012BC05DF|nr:hypothetical protein [Xanthovirga aplysinae]MTI30958.1 hypothetical protein [Xanthovirga aplysinae]